MPKRIQRKRTRGWRMPEGAIYVGRPTRWGNPYRVGGGLAQTAADAVKYYKLWLVEGVDYVSETPNPPPDIREIRRELAGKDLACWCKLGEPCHADVLLKIANAGADPAKEMNGTRYCEN